jgi:hypothetical protein
VLFRRRAKQVPPEPVATVAVASRPEERAHELVLSIMRAAPDLRFRAARELGLLEPAERGSGPEFERMLLERARDAHKLTALEQAIAP